MNSFYVAGAFVGLLGIAALLIAIALRRVVPTNMVHIVQTTKRTTPYGRGKPGGNTYYAWPSWVPKLGVTVIEFPESIFQVALADYDAYDQARLPFVVDAVAFFRVEEAEKVAQRVSSFGELTSQLQAVLQGAVRRVLATNHLEEILESRSDLGAQFTEEVREQLAEWGVLPVKTIEFMDLRDARGSDVISNVMAKEKSRIEMESRVRVAENHRQAELAEIDAQRTVDVQRQDALQQVGLRTAEKDKAVGIANEQAHQEIKTAAKTTAERDMDVKKVQEVRSAEIAREVAVVRAEQDRKVTVVSAEAEKDANIVKAQGNLEAARRDAEGIKAKGEAAAAAEQAMLMAPVQTQITLAREIGTNPGYQQYLVTIEQVRAGETVGIEMAKAMQTADLKVIANSGDMQQGVASLGDLFSAKGGTNLSAMLAALGQTNEGKGLLARLTDAPMKAASAGAIVGALAGNAAAAAATSKGEQS